MCSNINSSPTAIERAVENAKAVKYAYEKGFEDELLAQIGSMVENLSYADLVRLNGKSIRIGYTTIITEHDKRIKYPFIKIGSRKKEITSEADLLTNCSELCPTLKDIYYGFRTAYDNIMNHLLTTGSEDIPGIKFKSVFGFYSLALDI